MTPSPILDLYRCSELLQRCCHALDADGNTDAARACREAACDVLAAIAATVRQRAEQVTS